MRRLENSEGGLHSDYKNWEYFLDNYTQLKLEHNGWKLYSSCNCHYVLAANGEIHVAYGYHIWKLFSELSGMDILEVRDLL
jgi:hypothetical protein